MAYYVCGYPLLVTQWVVETKCVEEVKVEETPKPEEKKEEPKPEVKEEPKPEPKKEEEPKYEDLIKGAELVCGDLNVKCRVD
jgi:hypothetical protein